MSFTIWFTGISGAGKSTLSKAVYTDIRKRGLAAELLDGDLIRANFSQELTYSKRDRDINVRRIGFVSHLLNRNGVISVVAAIAPYAEARASNRALLGNYIEVFCDCSVEAAIARDPKGLYKRALAGEIKHFTGISDPYEEPESPDIVAHTDSESIEASVCRILTELESRTLIPSAVGCSPGVFNEEDEERWKARLRELGYARS